MASEATVKLRGFSSETSHETDPLSRNAEDTPKLRAWVGERAGVD
jgi:hypothetical protein